MRSGTIRDHIYDILNLQEAIQPNHIFLLVHYCCMFLSFCIVLQKMLIYVEPISLSGPADLDFASNVVAGLRTNICNSVRIRASTLQ